MRIITPQNAALSPDGSGGGNTPQVSTSRRITTSISADGTFGPGEIGPLPVSGPYFLTLFIQVTSTAAAAGTITLSLTTNGGATVVNTAAVNLNGLNDTITISPIAVTVTPIQMTWTVAGHAGGAADVLLVASAVRMF